MNSTQILEQLTTLSCPNRRAKMSHFGSNPGKALGVTIPHLRKLAKEIGKDHAVALELWNSAIHEARILASMIDEVEKLTEQQMDDWVKEFDSWDICDQVCLNLFVRSPFVPKKILEWSEAKEEFIKRAAFALIATAAVHIKQISSEQVDVFFTLIKKAADDNRNFVKKAVNWALRQLGKRNLNLNKQALTVAQEINSFDSKSAHWIAKDAIRELQSDAIQKRLRA